jgi:hypothetical protein
MNPIRHNQKLKQMKELSDEKAHGLSYKTVVA